MKKLKYKYITEGALMTNINRIANAFAASLNIDEVVERTTQKSYLISSDMAHGIHPKYLVNMKKIMVKIS